MEQKFDYSKAIEELEAIAAKVEDPKTGIDDIDKSLLASVRKPKSRFEFNKPGRKTYQYITSWNVEARY